MRNYVITLGILIFTCSAIKAQDVFIYNKLGEKISFQYKNTKTIININNDSLSNENLAQIKSKIYSLCDTINEVNDRLLKVQLTETQKQNINTLLGNNSLPTSREH